MRTPDDKLAARRREQILAAAYRCFVRTGFHSTGMKAICIEAGLSPGAVYRYFPGKSDIISALVASEQKHVDRALEKLASAKDPAKALVRFAGQLAKDACKEPENILATEIFAEACRDQQIAAILRASEQALVEALHRWIVSAVQAKTLALHIKPLDMAQLVVSLGYGVSSYHLLDQRFGASKAAELVQQAVKAQIKHG